MQIFETDVLIKNSSRGREIWQGFVSQTPDGEVKIQSKFHRNGSPPKISSRTIKGKNFGKKNETTPIEQAISEIKSRFKKKLDEGYSTDANDKFVILPMLAKPELGSLEMPVYIQPKIDGCRGVWDGEKLRSRTGKTFEGVSHLEEILKTVGDSPFDGEIIYPKGNFQKTVSLLKKEQPESKELVFIIYDIAIGGVEFMDRFQRINEEIEVAKNQKLQTLSDKTHIVNNWEELTRIHTQFVSEGYEGSILRDPEGLYEFNKRSQGLRKLKDFYDDEFKIVGITRDIRGGAVFICQKNQPAIVPTFEVVPKMTLEERKKDFSHWIGKWATIRYYSFTLDFAPKWANLITVRDYE